MKTAINIFLTIVVLGLGYMLYESIMEPIRFEKKVKVRFEATKQRLIDIRTAEVAYKNNYGKYTGSFDTLINFVKTESLKVVKAIGTVPDSLYYQNNNNRKKAEAIALKLGIVKRDTILISVRDSLFPEPYPIDSLRYVPFTNGKYEFELGAKIIETGSKVKVPVFEAKVHNNIYLHDLIGQYKQLIINMNDDAKKNGKYPGLKVGSLTEATNNAGNWE